MTRNQSDFLLNFSNITTTETSTMSTLVIIEQYMSIYGTFILTTLGIIGNVLSILIFLSPRYRRQSSHFYLLSLALSDLCFLIINLIEDTFRNHNALYHSRINILDRSPNFVCIFVQYARNVTRLLSSWIIVSFTIERLLVVFYPLKRAIICRRKIARFVVLMLFILTLLSNINVPFHYGIIKNDNPVNQDDTICDVLLQYRRIYMRFAISSMISVYLVPMCIIGVVNMLICCKLWRKSLLTEKDTETEEYYKKRHQTIRPRRFRDFSYLLFCFQPSTSKSSSANSMKQIDHKERRQKRTSTSSQYPSMGPLINAESNNRRINGSIGRDDSREPSRSFAYSSQLGHSSLTPKQSSIVKTYIQSRTNRVTVTLLLVSCSFLLLNSPYCAVWIVNYVRDFRDKKLQSIKEITELFMLTNFCINFLLYCVSGKVFRTELLYLLRCQWRELYDRNEVERGAQRHKRPKLQIQLQESKSRSRNIIRNPNYHSNRN